MVRLSLRFAAIAVVLLGFSAGCRVDPQFEGSSVRCTEHAECAHLSTDSRTFLCQESLCVRDESTVDPCGGPCPPDRYCDEDLGECRLLGDHPCLGPCPNDKYCDEVSGQCLLYSDHPCGGPCPNDKYCDEVSGQCRLISDHPCGAPCPGDKYCDAELGTCVPNSQHPCGAPCPSDKYCDEDLGTCVPNSQHPCGGPCPPNQYCDEDLSECKPNQNHPCGGPCSAGYVCDEELGACVGDPALCTAVCHPLDDCVLNDCEEGMVEIVVDPDPGVFARNSLHLAGTILWSGGESEPSVDCTSAEIWVPGQLGNRTDAPGGKALSTWSCALDLATLPEGPFVVVVQAEDTQDGLVRTGSVEVALIRDTTVPTVIVQPEVDTIFAPRAVTVAVTAEDDPGSELGSLHALRFQVRSPSGQVIRDEVKPLQGATDTISFPLSFDSDDDLPAGAPPVENGGYQLMAWAIDTACAHDPECVDLGCFMDTACEFPQPEGSMQSGYGESLLFVHRNVTLEIVVWNADLGSNDPPPGQTSLAVKRDGTYAVAVMAAHPEQVVGAPRIHQRRAARSQSGSCDLPMDLGSGLVPLGAGVWRVDMSAMTPCLDRAQGGYALVATARSVWTVPSEPAQGDTEPLSPVLVDCNNADELKDSAACAEVVISRVRWQSNLCTGLTSCQATTPAVAADGTVYTTKSYRASNGTQDQSFFDVVALTPNGGNPSIVRSQRVGTPLDGPVVLDRVAGRRVYVWSQDTQMRLLALDPITDVEWSFPGAAQAHQVAGLPAVEGGMLYVPVLWASEPHLSDRIAWMDALSGATLGNQSINLFLAPDTSLVLYRNRQLTVEMDQVALVSPSGLGASLTCAPDAYAPSGWYCPTWAPIDLLSDRAGTLAVDLEGFLAGTDAELSLRQWATGGAVLTAPFDQITAGPVVGPRRAAAANQHSVLVWNLEHNVYNLLPHGRASAVQGISMGSSYYLYLLHEDGHLQARAPFAVEPPLWNTQLEDFIAGATTPTIASHGTHFTDWTHAVPGSTRATGVLYAAHGGKVTAFIIDEPGPTPGWPNLRGGPNRTGTRNYLLQDEVTEPVEPDPGIDPPPDEEW